MTTSLPIGSTFDHHVGDLLFQDLMGSEASAIESVTPGYCNAEVSHMGIVACVRSGVNVIEAVYPRVHLISLQAFLNREKDDFGRPRVFVGRLKVEFRRLIPKAIQVARGMVGTAYDPMFMPSDRAYYCSELVVDAFKCANGGKEFFPEHPMSFRDMETNEIPHYWKERFEKFGMQVPEGEPGSNPGSISLSCHIDIVHRYGFLTNWS